jgi:hypothetical protein
VKIKAVKNNINGLTRAENTAPKFVMPKNDLNNNNIEITLKNRYFTIVKKGNK